MSFEYKVVPAPVKGVKAKGVKGAEARFAHALSELMNHYAAEGWEYLRADTLPTEKRAGLTGKTTVFCNMLVFRRALSVQEEAPHAAPAETAPPAPRTPAPQVSAHVAPPVQPLILSSAGAVQAPSRTTSPVDATVTRDPHKVAAQ